MFHIETDNPSQLKRIAAAGTAGILVGLAMVGLNLVAPLVTTNGFGSANVVFGVFGLLVVVLATHPTYQAAQKLDAG